MNNYELDKKRYGNAKMSKFQKYWRLANEGGGYGQRYMNFYLKLSEIKEI